MALDQDFLPVIRFSLVSIIPPMFHTHLYLYVYLYIYIYQKDKRAKPGNLQIKLCYLGSREHWKEKYLLFYCRRFLNLACQSRTRAVLCTLVWKPVSRSHHQTLMPVSILAFNFRWTNKYANYHAPVELCN